MNSDDKRYLKQLIETIDRFSAENIHDKCEHPVDGEITNFLKDVENKLSEDPFDLFRFKGRLLEFWKRLIEKSIACLRYFDSREPFISAADNSKKPYAYGVQNLYEYFRKYNDFENLLYGGSEYYRDHVIHVFRVWIIGTDILLRENANFLNKIEIAKGFEYNGWEKLSVWTIIAMTHDLGYPLEKSMKIMDKTKDMMKCFVQNPIISMDLSFSGVQNQMNDFVIRFMSSKMWKAKNTKDIMIEGNENGENEKDLYVARLQPKFYFKFQKSLEQNMHGVLSSLLIYKMLLYFLESDYSTNEDYVFDKEDARQFYMRREILRAISSHTCHDVYQLHLYSFSLLLIIADDAQEWGRKQISELYVQKETDYEFKGISLNGEANDTTCTMNEQYTISTNQQFKQIIKQFVRISLGYNDWFRDGQDTEKRDFNFNKITKITVKSGGADKDLTFSLCITKQAASTIEINMNINQCEKARLTDIIKGVLGEDPQVTGNDKYTYCVMDVKRYCEADKN